MQMIDIRQAKITARANVRRFIRNNLFFINVKYLKKTARIDLKNLIIHIKMDFYQKNIFFKFLNRKYSDRSGLDLSDGTIRIQNFHSSIKL